MVLHTVEYVFDCSIPSVIMIGNIIVNHHGITIGQQSVVIKMHCIVSTKVLYIRANNKVKQLKSLQYFSV